MRAEPILTVLVPLVTLRCWTVRLPGLAPVTTTPLMMTMPVMPLVVRNAVAQALARALVLVIAPVADATAPE